MILFFINFTKNSKTGAEMGVGERIRQFRRERGMTLEEAAQKAGMQASNLSDIEKSKRDIRTRTLERIASALGCNPNDLLDPVYEMDDALTQGLKELIEDKKTCELMSITDGEIEWMKSVRFRPNQNPAKKDYIDLLFIYRNIG